MPRSSRSLACRLSRFSAIATALLGISAFGCAGSANSQVGYTTTVDPSEGSEEKTADEKTASDSSSSDRDAALEGTDADLEEDQAQTGAFGEDAEEEPEPEKEPAEAELARQALRASAAPDNHLGVTFALSERASDLPWVLAIENRSTHPVKLASLPELIHFTVTPPAVEPTEGQKPQEITPTQCGAEKFPKSLDDEEQVTLRPGELIFHAFDPRDLCESDEALRKGAKVEVTYGFPLDTKKLWKAGKMTTVEIEQKAPFVAEREQAAGEGEVVPIKHLKAEPFVLGVTYPLDEVSALPANETGPDGETTAEEPPPPPPLTLAIAPLGTMSEPEERNVQVTIRNTSGKSMRIFVRRELITFEVIGPKGGTTCRMHPAERAPDSSAFTSLSAGGSTTLVTRLAEVCPQETWSEPGDYSVSARIDANQSGADHGLDAFTGTGVTTAPAKLVVPAGKADKRPLMVIVRSQPPR